MILRLLPFFAALLAAGPAAAVVGGAPATDASGVRRFTVAILTKGGAGCSGAVVAPRLVLTAAHCLAAGRIAAVVALDPAFRPRFLAVAGITRNPGWVPGLRPTQQTSGDIGFVMLRDPLPADMRPIDVASDPSAVAGSSRVTIAGYGRTSSGDARSAGRLREAQLSTVGLFRAGTPLLVATGPGGPGSAGGACFGDSGGPVIARQGGAPVLVGVVSFTTFGRGGRPCDGGYTVAAPVVLPDGQGREALARLGGIPMRPLPPAPELGRQFGGRDPAGGGR